VFIDAVTDEPAVSEPIEAPIARFPVALLVEG